MSKNAKIWIVIGATLLIGVVVYAISRANKPFITDSWRESYAPTDKGPYGTFVFKELLDTTGIFESFIQIDQDIENKLIDHEDLNDIYFFIGLENYMSESNFEHLIDFVENGNTAFISAHKMPEFVLDYLFLKLNETYQYTSDSIQNFYFTNSALSSQKYSFKFIRNNEVEPYTWVNFNADNFIYHDDETAVLGQAPNERVNFIKIQLNGGAIYLHSTPYLFSNIAFFRFDGFNYAEAIIKHLPPGKIQWDIYNLDYHYYNDEGDENGDSNAGTKRNLFEFIFKHTALTWGFFILLITAILYAIFKGKRKQDVIPAIAQKTNSSLRYIETVSSLYLQAKKHNKLVEIQKKAFVDFVSEHYFIKTHKINAAYILKLSAKSGVEVEKINQIFILFKSLSAQSVVSDYELIQLQQEIEYFYKTCK